jgi:hypothetical protein
VAFIVAIHNISDPDPFWAATADTSKLPSEVTLYSTYPQSDGSKAVCLWQASSVDRLREIVDAVTGDMSRNEFFEVDPKHSGTRGLPA